MWQCVLDLRTGMVREEISSDGSTFHPWVGPSQYCEPLHTLLEEAGAVRESEPTYYTACNAFFHIHSECDRSSDGLIIRYKLNGLDLGAAVSASAGGLSLSL